MIKIFWRLLAILFLLPAGARLPAGQAAECQLLARSNLVAWCIVPFDAKKRGPVERAEMATRLGFSRIAYDWREQHVPTFEQEILEYQKRGLEFFAFWDTHDKAFELFAQHGLHPQFWVTAPSPAAAPLAPTSMLRPSALRARPEPNSNPFVCDGAAMSAPCCV